MNNRKILIIFIAFVAFIMFSSLINIFIEKSLKEKKTVDVVQDVTIEKKEQKLSVDMPEEKKRKLVPEDPAKYGMIVQKESRLLRTQDYWDIFLEKALIESGTLKTEEAQQALKEAYTDEITFQEDQQRLNERIAYFEQEHNNDRSNEETKSRLEKLYMLKSMSKILKDKVVVPQGVRKAPAKVTNNLPEE